MICGQDWLKEAMDKYLSGTRKKTGIIPEGIFKRNIKCEL